MDTIRQKVVKALEAERDDLTTYKSRIMNELEELWKHPILTILLMSANIANFAMMISGNTFRNSYFHESKG